MNLEEIKANWLERGFSFGIWIDPPGQTWEDYIHDSDEVFMLVAGHIELEIADKSLQPAAGEEIMIPANTKHSVRNIGDSTSRWLYGYKT